VDNVALGSNNLQNNTTGNNNVALGQSALRDNTTGGANVALGQMLYYQTQPETLTLR
jgi:trimeric autotransporter adhesin